LISLAFRGKRTMQHATDRARCLVPSQPANHETRTVPRALDNGVSDSQPQAKTKSALLLMTASRPSPSSRPGATSATGSAHRRTCLRLRIPACRQPQARASPATTWADDSAARARPQVCLRFKSAVIQRLCHGSAGLDRHPLGVHGFVLCHPGGRHSLPYRTARSIWARDRPMSLSIRSLMRISCRVSRRMRTSLATARAHRAATAPTQAESDQGRSAAAEPRGAGVSELAS
jgi:hypothetical protein